MHRLASSTFLAARSRLRVAAVALAAWAWGCGPTIALDDGTEGSVDDGATSAATSATSTTTTSLPSTSTTTSATSTTTTSPPSDETTIGPEDTGTDFITDPDGGLTFECDVIAQDCPRGEKCVPWSNDDTAWNDTRCSPVVDDPDAVGDPCVAMGSPVSGLDTCDFGAMCWGVDPVTLEGTCVALCTGDEQSPSCKDADASCAIAYDDVVAVCLPGCDPLLEDCGDGQACYATFDGLACLPDASGDMGAPGDPCTFTNTCDPGSTCAPPDAVPDCAGFYGCCTAFCELTDPMPPCLPGQLCQPWFAAGQAPGGLESLGYCEAPV